ncbi:MAG: hypothetical protein V1726_06410 [Methanobacteriota archaeon]
MEENIKHTNIGIISLVLGILGVILIMNWLSIPIWGFVPFVIGIFAIITGRSARKQEDKYGDYGLILGAIAFALGLIQVIAILIYIYVTTMI